MSDYILRGTANLLRYSRTLGMDEKQIRDQIAAATGIPRQLFSGNGREGASYVSPKYNEAKAQALAALLGVSVANVTTNGGQEIVG